MNKKGRRVRGEALVDAISPKGRDFRIWKNDSLDGKWEPFSSAPMDAFATRDSVDQIGRKRFPMAN
jgi:hypothetical protein